jgi:aspartate carbamoyltransferase catalytic subunit
MSLRAKDLLSTRDLGREQIEEIFALTDQMSAVIDSGDKKRPDLTGRTVLNLFYENSTRTRMSFELAAKYLGANAANVPVSQSSVAKGENLIDTGRNLEAMGTDVIVIRHSMAGAPHLLAQNLRCSVVNAGDGMNEHPTQALLDLYTMRRHKGRIEGLKVAILGDILHSRVARSNLWALPTMGARVTLAGPATMMPRDIEKTGARVLTDVREAVRGADVVMVLRIQLERQKSGLFPSVSEYSDEFGVDNKVLSLAAPGALLMHPGPVNRGLELMSEAMDGPHSVILDQVTNGTALRMAILSMLAGRK